MGALLVLLGACGETAESGPAPASTTTAVPTFEWVLDLDDKPCQPLPSGDQLAVLLFVRTDCPISNRYAPAVCRIIETYQSKGVKFWLVYPDVSDGPESLRQHIQDYQYSCPALQDAEHELVAFSGVQVTPEAVVYRGTERLYRGRIDNWYEDLNRRRPSPTTQELTDALDQAILGVPVQVAELPGVGCKIEALRR